MAGDAQQGRPRLIPQDDGPFIYDNPLYPEGGPLLNGRGEKVECGPRVSLCRCGGSMRKPFCDGTHEALDFKGEKQADGSQDRRRDYVGKRITIHFNNGICSHAGFCWRGVPDVFRLGERPWIHPDGASPEDIIAVIEQCPSGALSYTVDGVEHRDLDREPAIHIIPRGPYCLVGGIEVEEEEPRAEQVSREHSCCCRCGASRNKPFCDGSHFLMPFEDEGY